MGNAGARDLQIGVGDSRFQILKFKDSRIQEKAGGSGLTEAV
jgi:hypothetical protein